MPHATRRAVGTEAGEPPDRIALDATEPDERVRLAITELPERQRLVLFLRYFADLDYAAIGHAMHVRPGTVGAALNAARAAALGASTRLRKADERQLPPRGDLACIVRPRRRGSDRAGRAVFEHAT